MTDLRTGAAGAVCVKHFANAGTHDAVSFVGTGVIAKVRRVFMQPISSAVR